MKICRLCRNVGNTGYWKARKAVWNLEKLMRDSKVDEVICATDAGREGELIFRLVYEQAGCKKPMKRLWISSMEEQAIKDGFASLKDGSCYDSLYQSALCRAKADWLVGINASRLFSVLYNQNLKVGRVQTPTLAMIVDRNQKIKEFTKENIIWLISSLTRWMRSQSIFRKRRCR